VDTGDNFCLWPDFFRIAGATRQLRIWGDAHDHTLDVKGPLKDPGSERGQPWDLDAVFSLFARDQGCLIELIMKVPYDLLGKSHAREGELIDPPRHESFYAN
jgi:hypothetical protein